MNFVLVNGRMPAQQDYCVWCCTPIYTGYLRDIVTTLCETFGTTLIYVSHYQQELPACIDHWLRLDKGVAQSL